MLSREPIDNKFQVVLLLEKTSDVAKNVKSLLEQLKVCIFAEIIFGVRCTLSMQPPSFSSKVTEVQLASKPSQSIFASRCLGNEPVSSLGGS